MLTIDGASGEGGGQILRTALSLSMGRHRPFRIYNIRKTRSRPGLQPQHLMAIRAAAAICSASVSGAELNSGELLFRPGSVKPGPYDFDIGTAGSTSLVLQTVLPALLCAGGASRLTIRGGTHNPHAPPYEFLANAFLPLLRRMGAKVALDMIRPGYYPAGGGCVIARIEPVARLQPIELKVRGRILRRNAIATLSHLPAHVALRELQVVRALLGFSPEETEINRADHAVGQGNSLAVTLESEHVVEVFTGIGERGIRAETVATRVAREVKDYLQAGVPVGEHLADQLLLPLALAGSGGFVTLRPTLHAMTNMEVIGRFLDIEFTRKRLDGLRWSIELAPR